LCRAEKLYGVARDIITLPEYIQAEFSRGGAIKGKRFGGLRAVKLLKKPTTRVRCGKVVVFSGCKSRPGTGSLHPVAIETAVEVTKLLKPSM